MSGVFWVSYGVLWVLVLLFGMLSLALVRTVFTMKNSDPPRRIQQGVMAPLFEATTLDGQVVTSAALAGRLTALLFASPNCATCMTTMDELNALSAKSHGNVMVVCHASQDDCVLLQRRHELTQTIIVDEDGALARLFSVSATPTAVIVDEVGRILTVGNPQRGTDLEALMGQEQTYTPHHEPVGAP